MSTVPWERVVEVAFADAPGVSASAVPTMTNINAYPNSTPKIAFMLRAPFARTRAAPRAVREYPSGESGKEEADSELDQRGEAVGGVRGCGARSAGSEWVRERESASG